MAKEKYKNSRKGSFLESIPLASIESTDDKLACKSKFNFAYFDDTQKSCQSFSDWDKDHLVDLLEKLRIFSREPLSYWENEGTLVLYGGFPQRSSLKHPKHIPHQAFWGRFRLAQRVRLVGFVLPKEFAEARHSGTNFLFDCNTFYIVFLDKDHKFYLTEAP
jgi:hypothetical protein